MHLALFGCVTKLSAKQAKLMKMFVSRSRVGIFCNERTRSTPLDPKLTFWGVSYYLGAFGTVWLPYETRCKTDRTSAKKFMPRSRVGIFRNERTRSTTLDPKLMFFVHFVLFECIWDRLFCLTKVGAKWAELVQKFVPRSRVGIFCNERA